MAEAERTTLAGKCPHCSKVVDLKIEGSWTAYDADWEDPPERWTATQCPRCKGAALYLEEFYGQDQYSPDGWDDPYWMYPPQARRLSDAVPRSLRDDHREARECIEAKHYKSAVVMARRVLEGIADDQGYKKGDLFPRLQQMRDDGIIDQRLYDWADICRDVGNQGAHADKAPVTRADAEETLDFVEALLDYLYVFKAKYETFKQRREVASKKAAKIAKKASKKSVAST